MKACTSWTYFLVGNALYCAYLIASQCIARIVAVLRALQANTEDVMTVELPGPVAAYLAADKAKDPDLVAHCFTDDARVFDENHDYRGLDAIRNWKRETAAKYQYVVEPLAVAVQDETVALRARLTGNFPGSPAELNYRFTLANDKIASLEIQ
jgi:ketosteroid isomerase-like protein